MNGRHLVALAALMVLAFVPGSALASPPEDIVMLSSWTPEIEDGHIVGGSQSVTVANVGAAPTLGFSYSLDPAPCACSITEVIVGEGWLSGRDWAIPSLAPGESASITLEYDLATASAPDTAAPSVGLEWIPPQAHRTVGLFAHASHTAI